MRKLLPLLVFVLTCTLLSAQNNSNRLLNQPISPRSCRIEVNANLFTATTFIELEFYNAAKLEIEGVYYFSLSPGQAITEFQLELNGKYRDGTIEDRGKASNAYNTVVGKRIDPALLQMQSQNNFSLNIYPIAPLSSRKVTMTIQQILKRNSNKLDYLLPLKSISPVADLSVKINVNNSTYAPFIIEGLLKNELFTANGNTFGIEWNAKEIMFDNNLAFSIPLGEQPWFYCTTEKGGRTYFAVRSKFPLQKKYKLSARKLAIYWDVSITGKYRNIQKDIQFLKAYIETQPIEIIEITCFNQQIVETRNFQIKDKMQTDWSSFLSNLSYEGAVQLGELDFSKQDADQVFVFTNGANSYGRKTPVAGVRPLYCIYSYNNSWLDRESVEYMIGKTGGRVIDLNRLEIGEAAQQAAFADNFLMQVRLDNGTFLTDKDWSYFGENELIITGNFAGADQTLYLDFGSASKNILDERFLIQNSHCSIGSEIFRLPALVQYDTLIRTYNNWKIRDLGLTESIVTPYTAFIVLERVEDYIRFNIKLPKDLAETCNNDLYVKKELEKQQMLRDKSQREVLAAVAKNYNRRINWWSKDLKQIELHDKEEVNTATSQKSVYGLTGKVSGLEIRNEEGFNVEQSMSEVVVTSLGVTRQPKELGYSVSRIRSNEITNAKPVNLQNGLTGKVSGLNVQTTNSGVFGDTRITLRGNRSLTGNNQPLLVLDGNPISLNLINSINPNDILDITILKSPAATAVYGPDGSNGALLVNTKKGNRFYSWYNGVYKLKNCDEMDYIVEIEKYSGEDKFQAFKRLEKEYGANASFYYDMAQHFFDNGYRGRALSILFSAAGKGYGAISSLRAFAYTLEKWKMFNDAVKVYRDILREDSADIFAWRDYALSTFQAGDAQAAVTIYYEAIKRSWKDEEPLLQEMKATLLQEMNAIINIHRSGLDISLINPELIKPLPVDLRISVQCNKENRGSISILTPRQENLNSLKSGSGIMASDFQVKKAKNGKYVIRANYWDYYTSYSVPTFYKIMTFRNFGSAGQTIEIENVIMENQYGLVDIGEVRWN
jgi:TonB-dependent SusC/RagA subfamily outer membrane receptor